MDVEWALAGGRILLLQARPMTAVPPEPVRLNPFQRKVAPTLLDMFQTRPYPLDATTWTAGIIGLVAGMAHGLAGVRIPPVGAILPEEDGVVTRFVPPAPRPTPATLVRPFQLLARDLRFDAARWTDDPRFASFERELAALAARSPAELDWPGLRALPGRVLALLPGSPRCGWTTCPAGSCRCCGCGSPWGCWGAGPTPRSCCTGRAPAPRTPTGRWRRWPNGSARTPSWPRPSAGAPRRNSPPRSATTPRSPASPRSSPRSWRSTGTARPPARCTSPRRPGGTSRRPCSGW
ncbi:hypothetical protein ACFQXA_31055 [Nocardiopsis composta]